MRENSKGGIGETEEKERRKERKKDEEIKRKKDT